MTSKLTLTFDAGFEKRYSICIDIDEYTAREIEKTIPPSKFLGNETFETVVEKIRIREFRKNLFMRDCIQLGKALAERMEDAEGWHDIGRIEKARKALKI